MKERKNALYKLGEKEMVEEFMEVKEKHTFSDSYEDKKQKLLKEMEVKDHTRRFQRRKLIAENVTLESCDASVATKYAIYKDARDTEPVQASNSVTPSATTFDENQSVELNTPIVMSDDKYMYNASVEYTIEGYELRDTIAGLPQAGFGYTWDSIQNIVNSDGTFAGYTHREIKRGDGANSVNEVVGENHVDVKMVYVTMKVKNTSDKEVSEIKIAPQMCCLNEDGSIPNQYTVEKVGYEGRDVYCDALTMYQEDPEAYAGQQQHYAQRYRLAPGEEKEVHVGYLVDASRTNRMVLFFNGYGRIYKSGANEAANQKIVKLY